MPAVEARFERAKLAVDPENTLAGSHARLVQRRAFRGGKLGNLRHLSRADHAHIDDFDRIGRERMAVFPLVRLVETLPNLFELALTDDADRERDFQLVALTHIAQIAVANE